MFLNTVGFRFCSHSYFITIALNASEYHYWTVVVIKMRKFSREKRKIPWSFRFSQRPLKSQNKHDVKPSTVLFHCVSSVKNTAASGVCNSLINDQLPPSKSHSNPFPYIPLNIPAYMLRLHIYYYEHVAQEKSQDSFKHTTEKGSMWELRPIFTYFANWQKLILILFYNYVRTKYIFWDTTLPSNIEQKMQMFLKVPVSLLIVSLSVNYGEKPDICVTQNEIPSLLLYKISTQICSSVFKS